MRGGSVWDAKAPDTEVAADAIDDQHCPAEVYDYRKDEVPAQVPKLDERRNRGEPK